MFSAEQIKLFSIVRDSASESGIKVYVVGGMIRDLYLNLNPGDKDVDFIVGGNAIEFAAKCLKNTGGSLKKYEEFITAKISGLENFGDITEIDFASSRDEIYEKPGQLPKVKLAPIQEDLKRRDFSINALAVEVSDLIDWSKSAGKAVSDLKKVTLDFFSGIKDIESLVIRVLHVKSFTDDPTRIFRAVRYAARIAGSFDPGTEKLLLQAVQSGALQTISAQRLANELKKILAEENFPVSLKLLCKFEVINTLKLFDCGKLKEVEELCLKSYALNPEDPDLLYQTALRVFYYYKPLNFENSVGLGTNELKKLAYDTRNDLDTGDKQTVQRLSKAGMVFQDIIKGN